MKQKVTTIACVILLALQLNALVKAEEDRASGGASADFGGPNLVIGSGVLEEVIGGSAEGVDGTSADLYPSALNTEAMDPLELYDQGSVWSQEYVLCNKCDASISVTYSAEVCGESES